MIRYHVAKSGDLWAVWRDEDGQRLEFGRFPRDRAISEARIQALHELAIANIVGRSIEIDTEVVVVVPPRPETPRDDPAR